MAGGETEEEKIRVDILENQVMDNHMELVRLCYDPDFVSPTPYSQSPISLPFGPDQGGTSKVRSVADSSQLTGDVYNLVLQNVHTNLLLF